MGRLAEKVLLKEYVQEVLKEDDGGVYGDLAMADATQNPWGVSFGSGEDLYNIFVKPFVDVVQTTAGKTKELSQKGQTLLRVAFETVATTLIPVLTDSYNEIFAKDKERMDKIRSEYAEVYQSNWDAFKDEDFQLLMFMYNPTRYVLGKLTRQSPKVAVNLISIITGGTIDDYLEKIKGILGTGEQGPHRDVVSKHIPQDLSGVPSNYGGYALEGVIREDEEKAKPSAESMLQNPKLEKIIQSSQLARKMHQEAQQMIRSQLAQVYKQAAAVLKANSVQDLQQKLGKKLKGIEKLAQVDPKARQAAEQTLMTGIKKSMKTFYVKSLMQQAKKFASSGIDQEYQQIISKIKVL